MVDIDGMNNESNRKLASIELPWTFGRKAFVSILLVLHLMAVFAAPWAYPPPSSLLAQNVSSFFGKYQFLVFLNHGYRFFAPNPGPSHIVRYEIDTADGETIKGQFPDRGAYWPRLLYHRHFMISETVYRMESAIAEEPPADIILTDEQQRSYDSAKRLAESLRKGIARELLDRLGGDRVRLYLVEHQIPLPADVAVGRPLDDPDLYVELAQLAEYSKDEL